MSYTFSNLPESIILSSKDIRSVVPSAFRKWAAIVPMDFLQTHDFEGENINIYFLPGDHEDRMPFDKPLCRVAHTFLLEDGGFHFNRSEFWTVNMAMTNHSYVMELETVALHEIVHLIGLDHSKVCGSVMFPNVDFRKLKLELTDHDIKVATALYGPRTSQQDYYIPNHRPPHGPRTSQQDYYIPNHGPPHGDFKKHAEYQRLADSVVQLVIASLAICFVIVYLAICFVFMIALLIDRCFRKLHRCFRKLHHCIWTKEM